MCVSYFARQPSSWNHYPWLSSLRWYLLQVGPTNFNFRDQHSFLQGRWIVGTGYRNSIPESFYALSAKPGQGELAAWRHFSSFLWEHPLNWACFKTLINRWFSIMLLPPTLPHYQYHMLNPTQYMLNSFMILKKSSIFLCISHPPTGKSKTLFVEPRIQLHLF